eukprot:jgi/Mesvir1/28311/Mv04831-RA.1
MDHLNNAFSALVPRQATRADATRPNVVVRSLSFRLCCVGSRFYVFAHVSVRIGSHFFTDLRILGFAIAAGLQVVSCLSNPSSALSTWNSCFRYGCCSSTMEIPIYLGGEDSDILIDSISEVCGSQESFGGSEYGDPFAFDFGEMETDNVVLLGSQPLHRGRWRQLWWEACYRSKVRLWADMVLAQWRPVSSVFVTAFRASAHARETLSALPAQPPGSLMPLLVGFLFASAPAHADPLATVDKAEDGLNEHDNGPRSRAIGSNLPAPSPLSAVASPAETPPRRKLLPAPAHVYVMYRSYTSLLWTLVTSEKWKVGVPCASVTACVSAWRHREFDLLPGQYCAWYDRCCFLFDLSPEEYGEAVVKPAAWQGAPGGVASGRNHAPLVLPGDFQGDIRWSWLDHAPSGHDTDFMSTNHDSSVNYPMPMGSDLTTMPQGGHKGTGPHPTGGSSVLSHHARSGARIGAPVTLGVDLYGSLVENHLVAVAGTSPPHASISYQWHRLYEADGKDCTEVIPNAAGPRYVLQSADIGCWIRAVVRITPLGPGGAQGPMCTCMAISGAKVVADGKIPLESVGRGDGGRGTYEGSGDADRGLMMHPGPLPARVANPNWDEDVDLDDASGDGTEGDSWLQVVGKLAVGAVVTAAGRAPEGVTKWKFQWYRCRLEESSGGILYKKIVGAVRPRYTVDAKDNGCVLRVLAAPVLADGTLGKAVAAFSGVVGGP